MSRHKDDISLLTLSMVKYSPFLRVMLTIEFNIVSCVIFGRLDSDLTEISLKLLIKNPTVFSNRGVAEQEELFL